MHRLAARGRPNEPLDELLQDAEDLDRSGLPGVVIDTTGLDVADVLGKVSRGTSGWLRSSEARLSAGGAYGGRAHAPGEILWLCGPTGVGKRTVSWSVYLKSGLAGQHTAFLDLDQVGFFRPASAKDPGNHRLKAGNLAGIWRNFAMSGARRLVILGPLDRPEAAEVYRAALPKATITLCRMGIGRARLDGRIVRRGRGEAPGSGIAGDELKGLPQKALHEFRDRPKGE